MWSGDARPEGRQRGWGSWGKGSQPLPSGRRSGERYKLLPRGPDPAGEHTAQAADVFSCNVPPDCLSWYLAYSFYTCKLRLCVELFMPIRLQHIFVILLYRPIHLGALSVLWGTAPLSPRPDAPAGKDTPEYCLKATTGY